MYYGQKALKIVAVIAMALLCIPIMLCGEVYGFTKMSLLRLLSYFGIGIVYGAAGIFMASVLESATLKKPKAQRLFKVIADMVMLVAGSTVFIVRHALNMSFIWCIFLAVCACWFYYIGLRLYKRTFTEIFTQPFLFTYLVLLFFSYLLCTSVTYDNEKKYCENVLLYGAVIVIALTVVLMNQTNINAQVLKRRDSIMFIPKNLRAYNMKIIIIVVVVLFGGFLFRQQIADGISALFTLIIRGVVALLSGINLLHVDNTSDEDLSEIGEIKPFYEYGGSEIIAIVIFVVVVAALLVVFRKQIIAGIKSFFSRLIERLFGKRESADELPPYIDYMENIVYDRKTEKYRYLTLSQCLKAFSSEKDPSVRFRLGYRAYLLWLKSYNIPLSVSDTTNNQYEKGGKIYRDSEKMAVLVSKYDRVRYDGESVDDESMLDMEMLVKEIKQG